MRKIVLSLILLCGFSQMGFGSEEENIKRLKEQTFQAIKDAILYGNKVRTVQVDGFILTLTNSPIENSTDKTLRDINSLLTLEDQSKFRSVSKRFFTTSSNQESLIINSMFEFSF